MEKSTWATYRLLWRSPTASQSHCRSPHSWISVLRWEWSELDSGMAPEMASVHSEMVAGKVSEFETASGLPLESKLIGHICFEEMHDVWLAPLLIGLRFVWNGRDSRPGGVFSWLEVLISLCQGLWCNLPLLKLAPLVIDRPYVEATCLVTRYSRPTFGYACAHSTTRVHATVQRRGSQPLTQGPSLLTELMQPGHTAT